MWIKVIFKELFWICKIDL